MNTQKQRRKIDVKRISIFTIGVVLFAAVFAGAGSAVTNGQTIFVYENVSGLEGTWSQGENSITAILNGGYGYFADNNLVEGRYEKGNVFITVLYPTASISGVATANSVSYMVIGSKLYKDDTVTFTAVSASPNVQVVGFLVTYPNGMVLKNFGQDFSTPVSSITVSSSSLPLGQYQIQAMFSESNFVPGVPADYLLSKSASSFTVVDGDGVSISVDKPTGTEPTPTETPTKPTPTVTPTETEPTETEPVETPTETPSTKPTEAESPFPILGVVAGLVAVAMLRKE